MDYDKQPCRDDDIYKEMDKFQIYELTTCITYEMAKRNELVDEKLKKLEKLIQFREKHQYLRLEPSDDNIFEISEKRWEFLMELYTSPYDDLEKQLSNMIDLKKSKAFDVLEHEKFLDENDIYSFKKLDNIKAAYKDPKFWISSNITKITSADLHHMIIFFEKDLINNHYIYPNSSLSKIPGSSEAYYFDNELNSYYDFMGTENVNIYNGGFFHLIQDDGSTGFIVPNTLV